MIVRQLLFAQKTANHLEERSKTCILETNCIKWKVFTKTRGLFPGLWSYVLFIRDVSTASRFFAL